MEACSTYNTGDAKDEHGATPLMVALKQRNKAGDLPFASKLFVMYALEYGVASRNEVDNNGNNALHYAAISGGVSAVTFLLENRVDKNVKNEEGCTPLIDAVKYGNVDVVGALCKGGCNLNVTDGQGKSALHWAVKGADLGVDEDFGCAQILLDNGADTTIADENGNTAAHRLARSIGKRVFDDDEKAVELLEKMVKDKPVLMEAVNGSGRTIPEELQKGHDEYLERENQRVEELKEKLSGTARQASQSQQRPTSYEELAELHSNLPPRPSRRPAGRGRQNQDWVQTVVGGVDDLSLTASDPQFPGGRGSR